MLIEGQLATDLARVSAMIRRGRCVAWIGAGLPRAIDYPDWKGTVRALCLSCDVPELTESEAESADRLIDKAEECKVAKPDAYDDTIQRLFGRPVVQTRLAYSLLMQLPFKAYLTTNFDPILSETAKTHGHRNVFSYPVLNPVYLEKYERPIIYLHGRVSATPQCPDNRIILPRSEFDDAYEGRRIVSTFLQSLLQEYDVLFLGCRLQERYMREIFHRVYQIHLHQPAEAPRRAPQRFVVLPVAKANLQVSEDALAPHRMETNLEAAEIEAQGFQGMQIDVIRYSPSDRRHGELEGILKHLCDSAQRRTEQVRTRESDRRPSQ